MKHLLGSGAAAGNPAVSDRSHPRPFVHRRRTQGNTAKLKLTEDWLANQVGV